MLKYSISHRSLRACTSVLALVIGGGTTFAFAEEVIDHGETKTISQSTWTMYDNTGLIVGQTGKGTLIVENGGTVNPFPSTAQLIVGQDSGSLGTVTINGAGSGVGFGDSMGVYIGDSGNGVVNINAGGYFAVGSNTIIGNNFGSNGTVTVDGDKAQLRINTITVGEWGTGTLTIRNDGSLQLGSGSIPSPADLLRIATGANSVGTVNVGAALGEQAAVSGALAVKSIVFGDGDGTLTFNHTNSHYLLDASISGEGTINQVEGTTVLRANSLAFSGTTYVTGGALQFGDGGTTGILNGTIINNAKVIFNRSNDVTYSGVMSGNGVLQQDGSGTLILTGQNTYSGGTVLNAGTLSVSLETNLGPATGPLTFNSGTLRVTGTDFNQISRPINWGADGGGFDIADANNVFTLSYVFAGSGHLTKFGDGTLALSGDSSGFQGNTKINGGMLRLDGGMLGTGTVNVASGAALGGDGTIGGNTMIADGGNLLGQSGSRVNFLKDLTLNASSNVDVTLNGAPSTNELFHVADNLTVDGTLTVNPNSNLSIGLYRIFQSDNPLTDNGMHMVSGSDPNYVLQVLGSDGQVNLVNTGGLAFNFWDGTGPGNDGIIQGGDGIWNEANINWTNKDGLLNSNWSDGNFSVFQGMGGIVTIENGYTPIVSGIQFYVDGYTVKDGTITLDGTDNRVLVGNGNSTDSRNMTAIIASVLDGQSGINKFGYGTLRLTGANTYSGTTVVNEGMLELGDGGSIDNSPEIVLSGTQFDHGDLLVNKDQDFTLTNKISGIGAVIKDGTGTTIFAGDNTFSGGLTVRDGTAKAGIADYAFGSGNVSIKGGATLDLANFNETVGNLIGETSGDGDIDLGSGTLTLSQNLHGDFSGVISGTGGITKNGDGDLVLYGGNDYSGDTTVNKGTLAQGAFGGFSGVSSYKVASGALIKLGGFRTDMVSLDNGGDVAFDGSGGTVLNIAGDYVGNGGTLHMSTVLGGDNSLTDRMNVGGSTSGTSRITITNRQGFGAQTVNGIEIVNVVGSSDGVFTLNGDYTTKDGQQAILTDSAYAYTLKKGGINTSDAGNWYLVSQYDQPGPGPKPDCHTTNTCRFSPAAPLYESYTATLQALNKLPTLQQRVGKRYRIGLDNRDDAILPGSSEAERKMIWGRIEGTHSHAINHSTTGVLHQDINTFIIQAGIDGQFYENENSKLFAGIIAQYGHARSRINNRTGDGSGVIDTQGWGLGGTATWYNNSGFYLDMQAQANWYDSDLSIDAVNPTLKNGNKGFGYALSLEVGQLIIINQEWSLTPQAQLMFSSVDFDTFTDAYGASISNLSSDSLVGRLGLAANYINISRDDDGLMASTSLYGIANLYQDFKGNKRINYAGTYMANDSDGIWGGIGAGGTYTWADNKYAVYGEGSINTSLKHFADSYTVKGSLGFKIKW